MKNIFNKYKIQAIKKCKALTFTEKTKGLWVEKKVHEYFDSLKLDDSNKKIYSFLNKKGLKNKKILIIGGGTGRLGRHLAAKDNTIKIVEIDTSSNMCKHANQLAKEENLKNFISIKANCKKIPFKDNSFDYVVAHGVFRYIPKYNLQTSIREIIRVSKNTFIVSEPLLSDLISSLAQKIPADIEKKFTKEKITMFRMSLFYMLLNLYKNDKEFKNIIDLNVNPKNTIVKIISQIAGTRKGFLYCLICKK